MRDGHETRRAASCAAQEAASAAGDADCSHCGEYAWRTRPAYQHEIKRGFMLARVVRYLSEEDPPVCNKCVDEVKRLREWGAKRGAA